MATAQNIATVTIVPQIDLSALEDGVRRAFAEQLRRIADELAPEKDVEPESFEAVAGRFWVQQTEPEPLADWERELLEPTPKAARYMLVENPDGENTVGILDRETGRVAPFGNYRDEAEEQLANLLAGRASRAGLFWNRAPRYRNAEALDGRFLVVDLETGRQFGQRFERRESAQTSLDHIVDSPLCTICTWTEIEEGIAYV